MNIDITLGNDKMGYYDVYVFADENKYEYTMQIDKLLLYNCISLQSAYNSIKLVGVTVENKTCKIWMKPENDKLDITDITLSHYGINDHLFKKRIITTLKNLAIFNIIEFIKNNIENHEWNIEYLKTQMIITQYSISDNKKLKPMIMYISNGDFKKIKSLISNNESI